MSNKYGLPVLRSETISIWAWFTQWNSERQEAGSKKEFGTMVEKHYVKQLSLFESFILDCSFITEVYMGFGQEIIFK